MKTRKIKKPLKGMKIVKNGIETRISKVIDAISFEIEMSPYRVFGIHEFEEVEQLVILDEKPHYVWQEDLDHLNISKMNKKNRGAKVLTLDVMKSFVLNGDSWPESLSSVLSKNTNKPNIIAFGYPYTYSMKDVKKLKKWEKNRDAKDQKHVLSPMKIKLNKEQAEKLNPHLIKCPNCYSLYLSRCQSSGGKGDFWTLSYECDECKHKWDAERDGSQSKQTRLSAIIESEDGQLGVGKIIKHRDGKSVTWKISAEAHEKASKKAHEEFLNSYPPFIIAEAKDNYEKDNNTVVKPMDKRSYICGYIRAKLNSNLK